MKHKPLRVALLAVLLTGLVSCEQGGGELLFVPDPPEKTPPNSNFQVRTALYIDTAQPGAVEAMAAASRYVLADSGIYYFDYVVISGGAITAGEMYPRLAFSGALMAIVKNWRTTVAPLRERGIKVLMSITGDGTGVSFGSIPKNACEAFARQCADFCRYYGLDGVELYDINGNSASQSPYPAPGGTFWNGEDYISIPADDDFLLEKSWTDGAGNFADMVSYLIESLGASSSFQGDIDPDAKARTPILIREVGYAEHLPAAVPRYAFGATMSCFTCLLNDSDSVFGLGLDENSSPNGESVLDFVSKRDYGPVIINLGTITAARLDDYSKRLGRQYYGTPEEERGRSEYGLVYYTNMPPPFANHGNSFSTVSMEVYGENVVYRN